jgi:hypothetical protein
LKESKKTLQKYYSRNQVTLLPLSQTISKKFNPKNPTTSIFSQSFSPPESHEIKNGRTVHPKAIVGSLARQESFFL